MKRLRCEAKRLEKAVLGREKVTLGGEKAMLEWLKVILDKEVNAGRFLSGRVLNRLSLRYPMQRGYALELKLARS
jgi:hypothetical protein